MPKYLILTNHSYMLWHFRRELIEALLQKGEVVISTPFVGHEQDFIDLGCRCIATELDRRGVNPVSELKLLRFYKQLIKKEKPDLVLTYSIKPNIYGGLACQHVGIPYCANVQGLGTAFQTDPMASIASLLYRRALRKAKTVFFENNANADEFLNRGILPKEMITLLPGAGINLQEYQQKPWPSEENGIHFLYLGRIMREKGIDELLEAAERLKTEHPDKVFFVIVGFFDEEEYKTKMEDLAARGILSFHGFQQDPKPFYTSCHCAVLPSWHEGMSNVLLEAAAIGRPLITSDIPGCREAVDNGKTGFLVPKQNADILYQAMKRFCELSGEQRQQMGNESRKLVEQHFNRNTVVSRVLETLTND
jgi:galacturonosyltransferase